MPGGTTGTPITGGVGTGLSIASPLEATWLSLSRYAQIMGIAPPHFFGAQASQAFPIPGGCAEVWPRHSWQDAGRVSREELLEEIKQAEDDISEYLGFNLAPTFITNEMHQYPQHYRRTAFPIAGGLDVRGSRKGIHLRKGAKLVASGPRALTLIGTATTIGGSLAYTDEDGDGFAETATVTLPTTETEVCEMKTYFTGTVAAPEWEIRPAKSITISGGNVVMVYPSWLFIDPDIDGAYPTTDSYRAIDISTTAYFVDSVDVYRVYVDNTSVSARFFWESAGACTVCNGSGCDACALVYQDGCAIVSDVEGGVVAPVPAAYSAEDSQWALSAWAVSRDPDQVRVSYYAGEISQPYLSGSTCDPLKAQYAKAIAYMATSRLTKPICACPNVEQDFADLQTDLSKSADGVTYIVSLDMLDNPFGMRRGEVRAWNFIGKISREQQVEVAII
jgi:hypothetical protein